MGGGGSIVCMNGCGCVHVYVSIYVNIDVYACIDVCVYVYKTLHVSCLCLLPASLGSIKGKVN